MTDAVYPSRCVRPTKSAAEKALHALLAKALPDGWVAWHSLRFACRTRDAANLKEIDFVILVPGKGMIAVEVKGGHGWHIADGRMFSDARDDEARDPLAQILEAKRALLDELRRRLGPRGTPWIAHLVVFPDVPGYEVPSGYGYEGVTLVGGHLAYLRDELESFAERAFARAFAPDPRTRDVVHAMWCERWVPALHLRDVRAARPGELFELTSAQRTLAHRLEVRGALLITGGPGTGKSIIAREAALRWAEQGKRVAYFCYTIALANEMRSGGVVGAHAVRERMRALVSSDEADALTPEGWNAIVRAAVEAPLADDERADVVIVDEAQDFSPDDWAFVERVRAPRSPLLAMGDAQQGFLDSATIPHERFDVALTLAEQHRTPGDVFALAESVRCVDVPVLAPSECVKVEAVGAGEPVWEAVSRAVADMRRAGFEESDLAVLSLRAKSKMSRPPHDETPPFTAVEATDGEAPTSLVLDTALRFKGLERPWIVITDLGTQLDERTRVRLFVALTRSTVGVTLVLSDEERALFALGSDRDAATVGALAGEPSASDP